MANLKNRGMLYQKLTNFILDKLPRRYRENFYSWIESGKIINQGRTITEQGIEICHLQYNAVLFFNELPFREIAPAQLMALLQIWLNDNDQMRDQLDNYETDFDLELINDDLADLTFTIEFTEPLCATLNSVGMLQIDGQNYSLDDVPIYVAEEAEIHAGATVEQITANDLRQN